MKTTVQWLDQAKAMHSLSDYALAPRLGVSRSQMSKYRGGADYLSDDAAMKLSALLGIDSPAAIIACAHAERAKSDDTRAFWAQLAGMFTKEKAPELVGAGASNVGGNGRFRPRNTTRGAAVMAPNLAAIMRSFFSAPPTRFA